jgi:hypothetical protein
MRIITLQRTGDRRPPLSVRVRRPGKQGVHRMDWDWAKAVGVITAIVTCATALLTYLRERIKKPSEPASSARLPIRHLSRGARAPWISVVLRKSLPVVAIIVIFFLAASVWLLVREPSLATAGAAAFWTLLMASSVYQFRVLRRGPDAPSKVRREARVTIDGTYDAVFDRCESAIRKLGAKIISLDRDAGQIHARTGLSWQSFGERVDISVMRQGDAACSVVLTSDSVTPIVLVDYGKNSKNLDVLIANL